MKLLIVESPTKARTIKNLLGHEYTVISTRGHVKDLPKSRLGVDIENGFAPYYITIRGKGKLLAQIKKLAQKSKEIYVGTDPDREGEAIAYHIMEEITNGTQPKRVLFYEITKNGISKGLENPTTIDQNKVNAHIARRVLDRLVGYLVSPLLWKTIKSGLSAGRVQTVALRLIVEREREIEKFIPQEYWLIYGNFVTVQNEEFRALLKKIDDNEIDRINETEALQVKNELNTIENFQVSKFFVYTKQYPPPPPLITATLQQEASRFLKFSAAKTMYVAQQLFEGIKIDTGVTGLITYPRTDSLRIADEFVRSTRKFIKEKFGEEYLPQEPPTYKDRPMAQGAHEAIRPTDIKLEPEKIKDYLTPDQYKLYDLIYRRFLASQMRSAVYEITEVEVKGGRYTFATQGIKKKFDGFEKVYKQSIIERAVPRLNCDEQVILKNAILEQKFTEPPARYSEASLIKKLQVNGIGRPSTYATIVSTILERRYVVKKAGRLYPTKLGILVNDILISSFNNIFEIGFTKKMEAELDLVESNKQSWQTVVQEFYLPFKKDLDNIKNNIDKIRKENIEVLSDFCPRCSNPLVKRWGRFGEFVACSRYPECKYVKKEPLKFLQAKCPRCGNLLVERESKYGKFIGCSSYPKCEYIQALKKTTRHQNLS
ncbi:MAG: type I DNA topoisomerase [candidate division WOR-3 bacterium]|nr:type I DNA topoisomerase [candidate division WOR-3 bacterium]